MKCMGVGDSYRVRLWQRIPCSVFGVEKNWLGFSYIRSEYYELYQKFYDTELKKIRPHIQQ